MKITPYFGKNYTAAFTAFLFVLFAICSILFLLQGNSEVKKQNSSKQTEVLSEKAFEPILDDKESFEVTRVIDGDTIELVSGQKVRYIGIDTPETVHPNKTIQCFGSNASEKNKELVLGKNVRLEKDISDTDKFGRLLRYVYLDGLFINDLLVREGFAYATSYPPDIKYQDRLQQAQKEAQESNRGLWADCIASLASPNTQKQTSQSLPEGSCLIKGNISTDGEKIYHMPGQNYYDKTVIDTIKGERIFCSEQEAISAGWRKAKN